VTVQEYLMGSDEDVTKVYLR